MAAMPSLGGIMRAHILTDRGKDGAKVQSIARVIKDRGISATPSVPDRLDIRVSTGVVSTGEDGMMDGCLKIGRHTS